MNKQNLYPVLTVACMLVGLSGCKPDTHQQQIEFRVPVETQRVSSSNVQETIVTIGKLRVAELYTLSAKTAGTLNLSKVNQRFLGEGDRVAAGQLLATVSGEEARLAVRREEAEQKLDTATKNLEAATKLYKKHLIPTSQYGQLKDNLVEAQLEYQISENKARQNILHSPIDGFILSLARDKEGQKMASGQSVVDGQVIAKVASIKELVLDVHVLPDDLKRISVGMEAQIYSTAWEDQVFTGKVVRISAQLDEATKTLRAELLVDNPDFMLRPGMYVEASLIYQRKNDVVVIPSHAVANRGGQDVVFVSTGHHVEQRTVQLGIQDGARVEVVAGVNLGEDLVTAGINTLSDNMPIQIVHSTDY